MILSENFFEILWYNGAQYIDKSKVSFPKKISFGAVWAQFDPKLHNLYELLKRFLEIF